MKDSTIVGLAALLACKAALNQRVVAVLVGKLAARDFMAELERMSLV